MHNKNEIRFLDCIWLLKPCYCRETSASMEKIYLMNCMELCKFPCKDQVSLQVFNFIRIEMIAEI